MRMQISLAIELLICASIVGVNSLKILMAGSLERNEHKYFQSVALYLSKNTATENVVYQLQHQGSLVEFKEWKVTEVSSRYKTLQIGDLVPEGAPKNQRQVSRIGRFHYDPKKTEYDNYVDLDVEHVEAYFDQDDTLLTKLRELKFDVGIGGPYHADSLLFRALGLNYVKIVPEDIESHTMQFKFNMPVMLSAYPNSLVANQYGFGEMPDPDSHAYRRQFWKQYEYNRWIGRRSWMRRVRKSLPGKYHKELLDEYDQDHAMILGEGTKGLIYQSVMLKPPNVQPVFPIRDESEDLRTFIKLDAQAAARKGPVIVFNAELQDSRSIMFEQTHKYFFAMVDGLKELISQSPDLDIVVLHDPKKSFQAKRAMNLLNSTNVVAVEASDPFNIAFESETLKAIEAGGRQVFWLSQCTQQNFLTAFEKFGARFIGFANLEMSHTQAYNCHKVEKFNVGSVLDVTQLPEHKDLLSKTVLPVLADTANLAAMSRNVTFHQKVLAEDERISRMDLEYWLDYVYLFGVSDMIPLYDKVDPITFRNWDVYALGAVVLVLLVQLLYTVCCCRCACLKKKAKVE